MSRLSYGQTQKLGLPPGSAIYTGNRRATPIRLTLFHYGPEYLEEYVGISLEECATYLSKPGSIWLDVDGVHDAQVVQQICGMFKIHPLSIEDILSIGTRTKCEDFDSYLFIVLSMLTAEPTSESNIKIQSEQISIVINERAVITFQEAPGDVWDPVRKRLRAEGGRIRKLGPDYLGYALLDAIVDHYFVVLEQVEEQIEELDTLVLESGEPQMLQDIHKIKRQLMLMRKAIWPLREITAMLSRMEEGPFQPITRPYLRDLHDHVEQASDYVEFHREQSMSLLELYLAGASNRMNQVMKVLTVISTIFIPITFISSVYGMNFRYMPELDWQYGYFFALGIMAAVSAAMLVYFRRHNWL